MIGTSVDAEHVGVDTSNDVCRYDPVTQILDENHVRISAAGLVLSPIRLRRGAPTRVRPDGHIGGLRLRDRWGGWNGEPYTATSWRHVSIYERASAS